MLHTIFDVIFDVAMLNLLGMIVFHPDVKKRDYFSDFLNTLLVIIAGLQLLVMWWMVWTEKYGESFIRQYIKDSGITFKDNAEPNIEPTMWTKSTVHVDPILQYNVQRMYQVMTPFWRTFPWRSNIVLYMVGCAVTFIFIGLIQLSDRQKWKSSSKTAIYSMLMLLVSIHLLFVVLFGSENYDMTKWTKLGYKYL